MTTRFTYCEVDQECTACTLVICDTVNTYGGRSLTNSAEELVTELYQLGKLYPGRRLFYYDSNGDLDEMCHTDGRFTGFKPGPRYPDDDGGASVDDPCVSCGRVHWGCCSL